MVRVLGGRRLRRFLAGAGTLAVTAGVLAAGIGGGYPASQPQLLSGSAWLASAQVGQLTLLDGSSAEVAAQIQVAGPGDRLDVVQQAATAYAVNRSTGTIRRVDGATFDVTPPGTPLPGASDGLQAFAGTDTLYALDSKRGILTSADPRTLAPRGGTVPLATQVSQQAAALDGAGRLWVLDTASGDLVWIDRGQRHSRRAVASPDAGLLVLADGAPVVVDTTRRTAALLDPADATARTTVNLDVRPNDRILVSGSPHNRRLYVVADRGVLAICDLSATACTSAVPLSDSSGADLGAAVETGGRLFIPDYGSGKVWIVDLGQAKVVGNPKVLDPRTHFQLLTRDGVVFYNDPESEHAGVIALNGGVRPVPKYNPKDPRKGLTKDKPRAAEPSNLNPNPSPSPSSPQQSPSPPPPQSPPAQPPPPGEPNPNPNPNPNPVPQPKAPFAVTISLSKPTAQVGEDVTLKVVVTSGPAAVDAQWTFGDGATATGLVTSHNWSAARTYQVTVKATATDRRTATASVPLTITVAPPKTVAVPNVVGAQQAAATQQITAAGLVTVVRKQASNTVPAGQVISQNPAGGTVVVTGTQVTITVSSGKLPPFLLIDHAAQAAWRSGAGALPFPGSETDNRGFAVIRPAGSLILEDGSRPEHLETHPQWVNFGFINGDFTLPAPLKAGDHFRATVGFIAVANPPSAGEADFVVLAVLPGGAVREMGRTHDLGSDGILRSIDIDLSSAAGATKVRLRVEAGATSAQDWASWVAPRVEG